MPTLPNFNAIIFDLDGLVLDTEASYFRAWQQAANIMGHDFSVISAPTLSGLHYPAIVKILLRYFGDDFDLAQFNELSTQCWQHAVQQQGIERKLGFDELLAVIQQHAIPYCLATNSATYNAEECLAYAGLETAFPMIIGREQVQHGKPAPDIFLRAAECLQQPIARCLVLEDSQTGIQAAKAAGAIAVLIPSFPNPLAISYSDAVFADLRQVTEIIRASRFVC